MQGEFLSCFCYQTKYFYILTLPKVASSWLFDLSHTYPEIMDINSKDDFNASTLTINQKNLNILHLDEVTSYKIDDIEKDWSKLISGNNDLSRNFIFLLRNPVNKFVSGLMQDVLYGAPDDNNIDPLDVTKHKFLDYFVDYSNKEYLEKFISLNNQYQIGNPHWWTADGEYWDNDFVEDVVNYWIDKKLDKFFRDGLNVMHYKEGHKESNIYLYHKLLFNSKINRNNIKILDIDTENLYDYIITHYDIQSIISDVSYKEERNKTGKKFKQLLIKNTKKYSDIIAVITSDSILMYIDIYKTLYNVDLSYEDVFKQLR